MVVERGEIWWADLDEPRGSEPGHRRPVLVVQANAFNRSRLPTVVCVVLTSNTRLIGAPGNVLIPSEDSGLPRDSVANVTQIVTLDEAFLTEKAGRAPRGVMRDVDRGLGLVLGLTR